ncbi:MAG: hypothetical protein SFT68_00715 [Rickettsiaceae bacterium]|nr:hypothetical protein [Rickettsiaceae bacterium]
MSYFYKTNPAEEKASKWNQGSSLFCKGISIFQSGLEKSYSSLNHAYNFATGVFNNMDAESKAFSAVIAAVEIISLYSPIVAPIMAPHAILIAGAVAIAYNHKEFYACVKDSYEASSLLIEGTKEIALGTAELAHAGIISVEEGLNNVSHIANDAVQYGCSMYNKKIEFNSLPIIGEGYTDTTGTIDTTEIFSI